MILGSGVLPLPAGMRRLDLTCGSIAEDLALDEALLLAAEEEDAGPVLRIWEPVSHAVILGASGRLAEEVRLAACRVEGVAVYRRSSGGGTVVVGPGVVNVAVVLPLDLSPRLAPVEQAQVEVLQRFAESLRSLGPDVTVRGSGDLTVAGRKIAGSAQRRLRRHMLIHATILNAFDLDCIPRYLAEPRRQPSYREGRSHQEFVANLGVPPASLRRALGMGWIDDGAAGTAQEVPWGRVRELVAGKFGDPAWTTRF